MRTWTTKQIVAAPAAEVLDALTAVDSIRAWAPIDFEVEGLRGDRLRAGSRARVVGRIGGLPVGVDVVVHEADSGGLQLTASGPVTLEVLYALEDNGRGSEVEASVSVRGSGMRGRLLAHATEALLAGGVLQTALSRAACQAERSPVALVA